MITLAVPCQETTTGERPLVADRSSMRTIGREEAQERHRLTALAPQLPYLLLLDPDPASEGVGRGVIG